jgi:ATP-dependent protease ClpP protease subunit
MNLKHVKNILSSGVAEMLIYDVVGRSWNDKTCCFEGIDGQSFAEELAYLNQREDVTEINVRINSAGGSVLDGWSIFNAILNSKKPCNTFIDGLGASISGIIFQAGKTRYMNDFAKLMIHDPSIGCPMELMSQKQRNMISAFKDSLLHILENNSKLSKDELSTLMSTETWLTSSDSLDKGFCDSVINTGRVLNTLSTDEILSVANEINSGNNANNIKTQKMELVKNHLGINDANATEKEIISAIDGIKNSLNVANETITTKEGEIATKDAEIERLTNELNANVENVATLEVENAIEKGIFDESKKDELISQAKNNLDGFKTMVSAFKKPVNKIVNVINKSENGAGTKSLRDLEKENPSEVLRLKNEDPETYKIMYKAQYGAEPSI